MLKEDKEFERKRLQALIEQFIRNWEPTSSEEKRFLFNAELHSLTQQIYRSATEQYIEAIVNRLSTVPSVPLIPLLKQPETASTVQDDSDPEATRLLGELREFRPYSHTSQTALFQALEHLFARSDESSVAEESD